MVSSSSVFDIAIYGHNIDSSRQGHRQHKRLQQEKRELDIVTEVDWVTVMAPEVIIYVDQFGNPMYTSVSGQTPSTAEAASSTAISSSTPASVAASSSAVATSVAVAVVVSSSVSDVITAAPVTTAAASTTVATTEAASSTTSSAASSSATSGNSGYAITYSPYNADGTCKTQSEVTADFSTLTGYSMVRIYGVDCSQVVTVGTAAKAAGMKLFAGVYDITQVASEIATIVASGQLSNIHTISIGNELVNDGTATSAEVVAAIATARVLLLAAGYTGKVVTVDTVNSFVSYPALCEASDYAAANAHAFFNDATTASEAGTFVLGQQAMVSKACGGMTTMITETGWPSQGTANGVAVPSEANQATAVAALRASFSDNIILYNAYNDLWKTASASTFMAEQYWGIYGTSSQ